MIPWELKFDEFVNCNCAYGCPCQFNALPTHGNCEAISSMKINKVHFGEVDISGLNVIGIFSWPKAIHEGNGSCEIIVDSKANEAQRDAILKIMSGEETVPMATIFSVFATTLTTVHPPVFAPITIDVDVENRVANIKVANHIDVVGEPIRNPVSGEIHQARIDLPHGFEYSIAEMGSGTGKSSGKIKLDLTDSYGQFAHVHMTNEGPVRAAA